MFNKGTRQMFIALCKKKGLAVEVRVSKLQVSDQNQVGKNNCALLWLNVYKVLGDLYRICLRSTVVTVRLSMLFLEETKGPL